MHKNVYYNKINYLNEIAFHGIGPFFPTKAAKIFLRNKFEIKQITGQIKRIFRKIGETLKITSYVLLIVIFWKV